MKGVSKIGVKRMQRNLRRGGYYTTAYKIDGVWGAATTRALSRMLRWFNKTLGYTQYMPTNNGTMDKKTIKGLQNFLRLNGIYKRVIDGVWGTYTAGAVMRFRWN